MVITAVTATTVAQVAIVMGIATFPSIAPEMAARMGVAPSLIGYQMSVLYGTAMLGSPFVGLLVSRWGACRAMQFGLAMGAFGALLGLTGNVVALLLTSMLLGLGIATLNPAGAHLLFRYAPPQNRNLIFSLKQTSVPLGWMLMAILAPPITLRFGWQWALGLVLAVNVLVMLALQPFRARWDDDRDPRGGRAQNALAGVRLVWRHESLRWLSLTAMCLSFVQLCVGTFLVTMLVTDTGYTLVEAGLMLSVSQAAGVAGRIGWGLVADRLGDTLRVLRWLIFIMIASCASMGFLTASWPMPLAAALIAVFGASAVGWNGLFMAEVARRSPHGMVGTATAGSLVWNFFGTLSGPAFFAIAYAFIGSYAYTFGLVALVAVAGLWFLALCARASRQAAA
jgi:MFS family permease